MAFVEISGVSEFDVCALWLKGNVFWGIVLGCSYKKIFPDVPGCLPLISKSRVRAYSSVLLDCDVPSAELCMVGKNLHAYYQLLFFPSQNIRFFFSLIFSQAHQD